MNWLILVPVGILLIVLVAFLVIRNIKDEKTVEKQLNDDFRRPEETLEDKDAEEVAN